MSKYFPKVEVRADLLVQRRGQIWKYIEDQMSKLGDSEGEVKVTTPVGSTILDYPDPLFWFRVGQLLPYIHDEDKVSFERID